MKATPPLHLYVLAVLCLPFAPLFGVIDVDVNIYAVGQGNGVLVKGGDHAMLIDAGSSASRLTALFHNRAFRDGRLEGEKERYKIDNPEENNEEDSESATEHQAAPAPQLSNSKSKTVAGKTSGDRTASVNATSPTLSSALVRDTSSQTEESSSSDSASDTPPAGAKAAQASSATTSSQDTNKRARDEQRDPNPRAAKKPRVEKSKQAKQNVHEAERRAYIEDLLKKIRSDLPDDPKDQSRKYLQTVVVTHPDSDHYNLIPRLLEVKHRVKVDNIVLSGFYEDYEDQHQNKFLTWLLQMQTEGLLTNAPLFTGTNRADGKRLDESEAPLSIGYRDYARAYNSYLPDRTEREEKIEKALQIFGGDPKKQKNKPFFEILSMNAGHARVEMATLPTKEKKPAKHKPSVYRANTGGNANSVVLRLTVPHTDIDEADSSKKSRFIFAGDATEETWDHMQTSFVNILKSNPRFLETDYLLISHHGSPHEGCTSETIIKLLEPKACFLSVGRHKGYHHPGKAIIELLTDEESSLWRTKEHSMAYFGKRPDANKKDRVILRRRDHINHALFSTLIHGDMHVPMHEDFQVAISYNKMPSFQAYQNDALQDFLCTLHGLPGVSFKIVAGKDFKDAIEELEEEACEDDEHIFVWCQALGQKGNVHPYRAEVQPNLSYIDDGQILDSTVRHFLYDAENKTFTQMCVDESNAVPMDTEE